MISLSSRHSLLIALLFILLSVSISIYFYRKTGLPKSKKYFLIALKSAAIFLVLSLLLEPSILAVLKYRPGETTVVLVDNSRSVSSYDEGRNEREQINEIVSTHFNRDDKYKIFTFSNTSNSPGRIQNGDSIDFSGFETNLSSSLEQLRRVLPDERIRSIIVISDGVFNSGGNPLYAARTFNAPLITIGVGDTIQKKDAVLSNVLYNETAFTETSTKITAYINSFLFQDKTLTIDLFREGVLVSNKNIVVRNNEEISEVNFEIRESTPGIIRYRIKINEVPGEMTLKNNQTDFLINFIENKVNLLFISGGPGYDNSLISDILKRTAGYNTTVRIAKSGNEFYEGPVDYKTFAGLSAVFLLGYPTIQTGVEKASGLFSQIRAYNVPVIFFAAKNTDYKKLELLDEMMPFTIARQVNEYLFSPQIVASAENPFNEIASELSSTPQIFRNQSVLQKPGSEVVMIDKTSQEPVFIARKTVSASSSAFLGYGMWRWRLNSQKGNEEIARRFIQEAVGLTLLKEKKTKFKIYPGKNVFDYTENVTLIAEVYDENSLPTINARVKAKITSANKLIMENVDFLPFENKFLSTIPKLPPGDYTIEAEAEMNNIFYSKSGTRFLVDTLYNEYKITKSNFDNLAELSNSTGGSFINSSLDKDKLIEELESVEQSNIAQDTQQKTYRFNLWENKYILILIIALFSIEWFVRKRSNIP